MSEIEFDILDVYRLDGGEFIAVSFRDAGSQNKNTKNRKSFIGDQLHLIYNGKKIWGDRECSNGHIVSFIHEAMIKLVNGDRKVWCPFDVFESYGGVLLTRKGGDLIEIRRGTHESDAEIEKKVDVLPYWDFVETIVSVILEWYRHYSDIYARNRKIYGGRNRCAPLAAETAELLALLRRRRQEATRATE